MVLQIRDNLPEMDERVYKGEIRLLIPFAGRIFIELNGFQKEGYLDSKEEEKTIESSPIRKGFDNSPS